MLRSTSARLLTVEKTVTGRNGINPQKTKSILALKFPSNPKALLFDVDEPRSVAAYEHLIALADETNIGNPDALSNLHKHRSSEYFRELRERIECNQKPVLSEYLYYALTTNNVNDLQIELLETLKLHRDNYGLLPHLEILLTLRKWQTETDNNKKIKL